LCSSWAEERRKDERRKLAKTAGYSYLEFAQIPAITGPTANCDKEGLMHDLKLTPESQARETCGLFVSSREPIFDTGEGDDFWPVAMFDLQSPISREPLSTHSAEFVSGDSILDITLLRVEI